MLWHLFLFHEYKAMKGPELVFGLVSALGTDLNEVQKLLTKELLEVGYSVHPIHLSKLIRSVEKWDKLPKDGYLDIFIDKHQTAGNDIREQTGLNDALVRLGIGATRDHRKE